MPPKAHSDRDRKGPGTLRIGVLSDTHGHLDDALTATMDGADLILHAGDIDRPDVLERLASLGPVIAVRGNMDWGPWSHHLPDEEIVEAGAVLIYMIHDLTRISLVPETADIRIVISGHTHRPEMIMKNGVLYLNPGSASSPRGGHQATMAWVEISGVEIACRHVAF